MKKKVIKISSIVILLILLTPYVYAENVEDIKIEENMIITENYAENQVQKTLKFEEEQIQLYREYENRENELNEIKNEYRDFINSVNEKYQLEDLTPDNIENFRLCMNEYSNGITTEEEMDDFSDLQRFMDIYENNEKNDKIVNKVTELKNTKNDLLNKELALILPYTNENVKFYNNIIVKENNQIQRAYNVNNGINYARQYAWNPNTGTYHYFNGADCTNFISQILEASGVSQQVYSSVYSGWWHKKVLWWHEHSNSWTVADTFVRYMGTGFTTTDHSYFARNIYAGDYIAKDFDSDGDWDHVGFVVTDDNYVGSWGYYNYEVAQHTQNYLRWTSDGLNHWEVGPATWARVRR